MLKHDSRSAMQDEQHGVLQHLPAGLEAHLGRARRACHRWTPAARVVASHMRSGMGSGMGTSQWVDARVGG